MTAPRDPDRLIRAFLAEGPAELPDRDFDAVRSRIDRTHQRVVLGLWREPRMSTLARLAIAAAAVVVVGVVGVNLVPLWTAGGGASPSPSPSPSAKPSPSPTDTASPLPPSGALEPGTYRSSSGSMAITFTVPAGWTSFQGWAVLKGDPEMALAPWEVVSVTADPCHRPEGARPIGPTVDDLVSALVAQVRDVPATVSDVVIDGYHGKQVELVVPTDIDFAQCDGGQYVSWFDTTGGWRYSQGPGQHDVVRILDVNGRRLVVNIGFFDANSVADRAELQAVFDSVRIELGAPAASTPPA